MSVGLTHRTVWSELSDAELVAVIAEDSSAFGELVRRHQDFVYGAALRVVRNPTLAEDVAQEAFVRAYKALPEFRQESHVRSWLYRIATNLALNAVTRSRELAHDDVPVVKTAPSAERSAEQALLQERLGEAMKGLPDGLREPLVMRELQGLSYQEIADEMDLPLNTVRTRILRARRALRDELEDWR